MSPDASPSPLPIVSEECADARQELEEIMTEWWGAFEQAFEADDIEVGLRDAAAEASVLLVRVRAVPRTPEVRLARDFAQRAIVSFREAERRLSAGQRGRATSDLIAARRLGVEASDALASVSCLRNE